MFIIKSNVTQKFEIATSFDKALKYFSNAQNYVELMPNLESIQTDGQGIMRWNVVVDVPLIGRWKMPFAVEFLTTEDTIEWYPAGSERQNYLRCVTNLEKKDENLIIGQISHNLELRREKASEFHALAGMAGEKMISGEMQNEVSRMLKTFLQKIKRKIGEIMNKTIILVGLVMLFLSVNTFAQMPVIRESNKQEIAQTIGDSRVNIIYHRPNVKGRKNIFGCQSTDVIPVGGKEYPCLVPSGQVWRTGANDNTTIEFTTDVSINGQPLPAGKYAFFAIPEKNDWTLIFNKVNNEWGSFSYKAAQDALRVKTMPMKSKTSRDTLMYEFEAISGNSAKVVLSWEKLQVPFTVNVGDMYGRTLVKIREVVANAKADDMRTLNQAAGFVISNKLTANYEEAMRWLNKSIAIRETFGNLSAKARLFGEMGKTADAIATGEKAVMIGKAATPVVDTANFEKIIAGWKAKK